VGAPTPNDYYLEEKQTGVAANVLTPVQITSDDLLGQSTTGDGINFAETLGGAYKVAPAKPNFNGRAWSAIETDGFAPPAINGKSEQHFFINVGMNNDADILKIPATNGKYEETFTFTLSKDF